MAHKTLSVPLKRVMPGSLAQRLIWIVAIATWLTLPSLGFGQVSECQDEHPGHLVRTVKVKARWLPEIDLPLKRGDELTPDKLRETRLKVIAAINDEKSKLNAEYVKLGRLQLVDVNLVRSCVRKVAPTTCEAEGLTQQCVDVEVHPLALSTDPIFMASVLLPIPRSNEFTFLSGVPGALKVLDPRFGVAVDKELGTIPEFEFSHDLLSLENELEGKSPDARTSSLVLKGRGSKSLTEPFYSSEMKLTYAWKPKDQLIENLGVEVGFSGDQQPQLQASFLRNSFHLQGAIALNPNAGLVNRLVVSGGYNYSSNRLTAGPSISVKEDAFVARAIAEGRIFNGFTRAGVWLDRASQNRTQASYRRITGVVGYEKEIPLGQHTIGFETTFGFGNASRNTPRFRQFYGGNSLDNFIYQDISEPDALSMGPTGPALRSFGKNQAGLPTLTGAKRGAHSFQNLSLTVTVPIPTWSKPLIPDVIVNENPRVTLRDLVAFAVNSGQEALSLNYQDEGFSEDEADAKAAKVFGEIKPGINYLTNYAKIYSVKPMLMFDTARLSAPGNLSISKHSIGGGLQLTVVIAKFQVGYSHTLNRINGEPRGSFIGRLVFTNLF